MCGLVGLASSTVFGKSDINFFVQALYVDQLRGEDATGVALVDKDNKVDVIKRSLAACDFLMTHAGQRMIKRLGTTFVAIGHNRASTMGGDVDNNAHPFEFSRYVGAHNGTIANFRTYLPVTKYSVDSANLIASIDQEGLDVLKEVRTGSYALTLYDKQEQHLVFVKNEHRPLSLLQVKDKLLWCSESDMLHWLALRNNMFTKDCTYVEMADEEIIRYCTNEMKIVDRTKYVPRAPSYYMGYNNNNNASNNRSSTSNVASISDVGNTSFRANYGHLRDGKIGQDKTGKYDFSLRDSGISTTLGLEPSCVLAVPVNFKPFDKATSKGTAFGYIFSEKDACYFPAIIYNVDEEMFNESEEQGHYLVCKAYAAHCTKDGNLITFTCGEPKWAVTEDGENMSYWCNHHGCDPELEIMAKGYLMGHTYSIIKNDFVDHLHDPAIKLAYKDLKEKRSTQTHPGQRSITLVEGTEKKDGGPSEDLLLGHEVKGPYGKPILASEFARLVARGCGVCSETIYLEDAEEVLWYGKAKQPICKHCSSDTEKMEMLHLTGNTTEH